MTANNISRLLLLQDRLLKVLIKNEGKRACDAPPLNQMEQNGYVAASLLKALQKKNDLFVQVLSKMKASQQPGDIDSR